MDDTIDVLAWLFPECEQLGIVIPPDMPLDTYAHRLEAGHLLASAISARRHGRHHWLDGLRK